MIEFDDFFDYSHSTYVPFEQSSMAFFEAIEENIDSIIKELYLMCAKISKDKSFKPDLSVIQRDIDIIKEKRKRRKLNFELLLDYILDVKFTHNELEEVYKKVSSELCIKIDLRKYKNAIMDFMINIISFTIGKWVSQTEFKEKKSEFLDCITKI